MTGILDSVGMFDLAAALPDQVAAAASLADGIVGLPNHDDIENVVVMGMGGSGIAGDILAAVAGPFMSVPVTVSKGYDAPSFVGPGTLCFAVSYSGNTEETVESAQLAQEAGAQLIMLSAGGELADMAAAAGTPHVLLPETPMPRAGVGSVSIPALVVLERVGLFPGAAQYIADAVDQLQRRRDKLIQDGSSAQQLAREIGRTMPIAYGGDALGSVAAYRFKCEVNENAKAPAFWASVPEMSHNEICGWGQHGDVTRQVMTLVRFRHDFEHPQVSRRFELTYDVIDEVVHTILDIEAEGDGGLAQLFDLIIQGDFVSLHMAVEAGVDPGPIPVLEDLKTALAR
ncbi:MAG: bifunctional phosphoglucose/phosphomannose isomerase [Acidimicrobiales bacterium]